ncbi:MAG: tetratricopeptide repeat protein [Bacteroidota bacterium]|nr:tetratricopeptide repeat protein [Bacteroidota bacterium]
MLINRILLLFFLLALPGGVFSQNLSKIDSLEQKLRELPDDTVKVSVYTRLNTEWASKDPAKGIRYCKEGLKLAKQLNWRKGIAVSYIGIGFSYGMTGLYDSALVYNDSAIVLAEELADPSRLALVYINRGSTYLELSKLAQAQQDFIKAISYAEASGNTDRLARSYMALGNVHYRQDQWQQAIDNYQPALHLFDSIGNLSMTSIVMMNLGNCSRKLKNFEAGLDYYTRAIAIQSENEDITNLMATYSNIAILHEATGDTAKAVNFFEKSLQLASQTDDKEQVAISASYLGELYVKTGDNKKGMLWLERAYGSAAEAHLTEEQFSAASVLARVYAREKLFDKAYQYLDEAMSLNDTLLKSRQQKLLTEMQTKYETEKKEKENTALKAENDLKAAQIRSRNSILAGTVIGILLLIALAFFIFKNYRNEKRNVILLDRLNLQLTSQRDEILKINQLLQLKVLRTQMNPHFIYNCLNAINNLVSKGENEKASGYLLNFSRLLRMILDFSDKTYIELEEEIKFIRLYLSLESMRMGEEFSYDVTVSRQIIDDDISIPSLLIQPFIENAIWHGLINKTGDKKLVVRFEATADQKQLKCIVEDNGIGRMRAGAIKNNNSMIRHESKGIKITQERLELLQFQIKDEVLVQINDNHNAQNEPMGTRVELLLPVEG